MTEILCIGNPIVDIFIDIDKSLALKYGITDFTQHITSEQAEAIFSEPLIDFSKAERSSGGGAANAAKIAGMLGMNTVFSGCTGRDEFASVFEEEIKGAGVSVNLFKSDNKTGICFACNIAREKPPQDSGGVLCFAACPGAALDLTEAHISDEMISGAEVIILDGYILNRRPLVQNILLKASRGGIPVALDAASVFQVKQKAEDILNLSRNFPLFIFMNADETIAFYNTIKKVNDDYGAKLLNMTEKEKETIILRDISPILKIITEGDIYPIIVVKLGGRGAIVFAGGGVYREETLTITPRSTVGAGDAFCAAFISAWIRGKSLSECAALGNKVAREILEVPGTKIKSGKLKSFAKYLQK